MPIGTVLSVMASRHASRSPPVDKSITVSAVQRSAHFNFPLPRRCQMKPVTPHVGVDFGATGPADGHGVQLVGEVVAVGRITKRPGHFVTNLLGRQMGLSFGDPAHFFGHGAKASMFQLSDGDKPSGAMARMGSVYGHVPDTRRDETLSTSRPGRKSQAVLSRLWHARSVRTGIRSRTAHLRRIGKHPGVVPGDGLGRWLQAEAGW